MKRGALLLAISFILISSGCLHSGQTESSPISSPSSSAHNTYEASKWDMTPIWNVSTVGVPFMDLSPDGSLGAVIDWSG